MKKDLQAQKRLIVFQLLMNIVFLLLAVFMFLRGFITNEIFRYGGLALIVVFLIVLYIVFKKGDETPIIVKQQDMDINKYNLYVFMILYVVQIFLTNVKDFKVNLIFILVSSLLIVSAFFGIFLQLKILYKNKK